MRLHTDTRLKYLAEYQLSFTQNGFPCPGWGDPYVFFCQGALCTTFWAARCAGRYLAGVRLASVPANSEVVFPQTGCGNRGKLLRKEQQGGDFSTSSRFREPLTVWRRSSACRRNFIAIIRNPGKSSGVQSRRNKECRLGLTKDRGGTSAQEITYLPPSAPWRWMPAQRGPESRWE